MRRKDKISMRSADPQEFIDKALDLIESFPVNNKKSIVRQERIWKNAKVDRIPLLLHPSSIKEIDDFPHYNLKECFYDKKKMLLQQLLYVLPVAKVNSDVIPSMRVNLGTVLLPSVFGLKIKVVEDSLPWIASHLDKRELSNMEIDDLIPIKERGLIPRAIEYMEYFKSIVGKSCRIYLPDTQGPFDIAHLIRGNDIFTDIYDDAPFFHHLMELSTFVYIEVSRLFKEVIKEPLDSGFHSNSFYMGNCGVRVCEDSTIMLSAKMAEEFLLPYLEKAIKPFGGGWVHFCGNGSHLIDLYLSSEYVKGINFGNPEMYDPKKIMSRVHKYNKVYLGSWAKKKKESEHAYFSGILSSLGGKKKGLILVYSSDNEDKPEETIKTWESLHEIHFDED